MTKKMAKIQSLDLSVEMIVLNVDRLQTLVGLQEKNDVILETDREYFLFKPGGSWLSDR